MFFEHYVVSPEVKLTLTVGFLGGFSTFSTHALEAINMLRDKEYGNLIGSFSGLSLSYLTVS